MTQRVLIACPHLQRRLDEYLPRFAALGIEVEAPEVRQQLTEADLLPIIHRIDGIVAGDDHLTAAVIQKAERLRVIAKWGVGLDNVDLAAARSRGIAVLNTPGELAIDVAEVAIGYLVLLARRLHEIDAGVRGGEWPQLRGTRLSGKTLGIVGLGAIGRALAGRALAMEMHVIGVDPFVAEPAELQASGVEVATLQEMLPCADFVSLNCPLTAETHHFIGREQLAAMRPGVFIVNTARGALIDEAALVRALDDGRVAGAALDVFEQEPLPPDSPLRRFRSCVFGSHNSSNTSEAVDRINTLAVENLLGVLCASPSVSAE